MTRSIGRVICVVLVVATTAMLGWAGEHKNGATAKGPKSTNVTDTRSQAEPMYMDKPLSYWIRSIRDRDEEVQLAFDAVRDLGPDAQTAVPELTRIVAEPFMPVRIGMDRDDVIVSKLFNIQLRADAIDALTAIGEAAAPSSVTLIQWALTARVIPGDTRNSKDEELFVDLVTIDVLQRMRVAGAVAEFGRGAFPAVAALLASSDDEERKLAVAILSENALPIVAALLKSRDCEDRKLGIAILLAMWPVVRKEHLADLKNTLVCDVQVKRF
jgi:hypothetical protein